MKTLIAFGLIGVLAVGSIFMMWVGYNNGEVSLRNLAKQEQTGAKIRFDTMWKILKDKGVVTNDSADKQKEFAQVIAAGREGGNLMKFVTEANPTFDMSLFKDLSRAIESERTSYEVAQRKLLDIQRQHNDLLTRFPSSLFLAGRTPIEVQIVTSTRSEKAYETGRDDESPLDRKEKKDKQ